MEYYWELITKDDSRYEIPPQAVEVVKRRMDNHDPINLSTASIPYSEIKHFRITSKSYGQQPLLEAAAQAFNDPMYNDDGSLIGKWVKKQVPNRVYAKTYAGTPAYRVLDTESGMTTVAFFLPVHLIDTSKLDYCNEEEIRNLTR